MNLNKLKEGVVKYVDVLLFLLGTLVFNATVWTFNLYAGGIVTSASLIAWGFLSEIIFSDRGGGK